MVPTAGLEPATSALPRKCSTAELCGPDSCNTICSQHMERVMGIEPTPSAWKAEVLPLNYTRALRSNKMHLYALTTRQLSQDLIQTVVLVKIGGGGRIRTFEG